MSPTLWQLCAHAPEHALAVVAIAVQSARGRRTLVARVVGRLSGLSSDFQVLAAPRGPAGGAAMYSPMNSCGCGSSAAERAGVERVAPRRLERAERVLQRVLEPRIHAANRAPRAPRSTASMRREEAQAANRFQPHARMLVAHLRCEHGQRLRQIVALVGHQMRRGGAGVRRLRLRARSAATRRRPHDDAAGAPTAPRSAADRTPDRSGRVPRPISSPPPATASRGRSASSRRARYRVRGSYSRSCSSSSASLLSCCVTGFDQRPLRVHQPIDAAALVIAIRIALRILHVADERVAPIAEPQGAVRADLRIDRAEVLVACWRADRRAPACVAVAIGRSASCR